MFGFSFCQALYDSIHRNTQSSVYRYRGALSLVKRLIGRNVCVACVCVAATMWVPSQANKKGCSYLHLQLHTRNTSAVCVHVHTVSHF